jgi:hypothetical protein
MGDEIPRPVYDLANTLNEIELARALRASLAHQRARMIALLSELAQTRMEAEMPPVVRARVRAAGAAQLGVD